MKIKKLPGLCSMLLTVFLLIIFMLDYGYAQVIEINYNESTYPTWNILDKLSEKDDELAQVPVSIGSREIIYYENRISLLPQKTETECVKKRGVWDKDVNVCKSITRKRLSDKESDLGLKLLNTETGEIEVIKVSTKIGAKGVSIIAPSGYQIEIVERPNGIRWNLWNTFYRVIEPTNRVVIKNNFPRHETITVSRVVKGKTRKETKKVVKGFLYVPHSDYFEQDDQKRVLVEAGINHDKSTVSRAFAILGERGVKSRVFSDKLVADVRALSSRFFERLPLLEQGDLTEFKLDPHKTAERVLIILGSNGETAWKYTCNRSNACGWVQFTPRTYRNIRTTYPAAKLIVDFKEGAGNQLNSIMAAILLHDYNLANLVKRYGEKILNDPRLEEYLAAAYNGSPTHVHRSLDATISKVAPDWTKYLKTETHGFMEKLRYLVANDLP